MSAISVFVFILLVYKIIESDITLIWKQLLSIAISFVTYLLFFNWKVSLIICIGISFHEYCHILAARKLGISTKGFYLIPFLGGVALMESRPRSRKDQAIIYLMGPLGGGLLSILIGCLYFFFRIPILGQASIWMLYINLFNLLPFSILDGGRLLESITYSINRTFGMFCSILSTIIGAIVLWTFSPVIALIVSVYAGASLSKEINDWNHHRNGRAYLASEDWLNEIKKQSNIGILLTIISWSLTIIILYFSKLLLENTFNLSPLDLFNK